MQIGSAFNYYESLCKGALRTLRSDYLRCVPVDITHDVTEYERTQARTYAEPLGYPTLKPSMISVFLNRLVT